MITKEQIEQRKAELMADYHALAGAIQDCDYWLEQLESEGVSADAEAPELIDIIED